MRDTAVLWEPKTEELQELYNVHLQHHEFLYFRPDFDLILLKKVFFLITIDLAEGGGNDSTIFNIFQIVGKDKFKHVGYWKANSVDLEHAALEFWLLAGQLFNYERCMWSLEWNTYGALFYRMLMNLNEDDFDTEDSYRFNIVFDGLELSNFVMYKKTSIDDQILGKVKSTSNFIPGIKFTASNKGTACSLLKILFEKEQVDTTDLIALGELENFEDKNGNGTYKATTGHDDLIMTFVQIPMVQQTSKYKSMMEEYIEATVEESYNNKWASNQNWDYFGSQVSNPMQENIFTNRLGSYVPQQGGMYDIFDPTRNSNSIF